MSFFNNKLLLNVLACGMILSCPMQLDLFGATPKAQAEQKWTAFTSTEDGFSVDLPTNPEHVSQTIDIPNSPMKISYDTFISEPDDSTVYVISVWDYPPQVDMSKPEVNLQDGFGGMLSALPGSEVQEMKMTDVDGFAALEFLVKNEDIFFQGKLILVHNTLYQVFTVYKDDADMKGDYNHFISSFKLISPAKREVAPQSGGQPAAQRINV